MKILQVNKYYSPEVGGVETVCKQYSDLLNSDHEVTVLAIHKNFKLTTTTEFVDDVKVIRCSSFGTFLSMPISVSFLFYFWYLTFKNNLIYLHLPCPLIDLAYALSFFKRKVYVVWHSDIIKQKKLKKLLHPLLTNTIRRCTKIIVTSPNMIKYSSYLGKFENKCEIIPLSVDVKNIKELASSSSASVLFPDIKNIDALFFGRLCYYKGIETLIESLILLNESDTCINVVIAGSGEYSTFIKEAIETNNLKNVVFINRYLTVVEKYVLLKESKFFLFPSVEPSEAFGITQLEAMCLNTPVINSNLASGVPWVSQHELTGITTSPYCAQSLKNAMLLMKNDDELTSLYANNASDRVDELFSNDVVYSKIKNISE